ncbi:MAG TPA: hypothetical protein VIU82_10405 [Bosea sp. (in: a-proteobacteria)]
MPRPPSRTGLDDATQRELCWWIAKGCSPEEASKRAGLPNSVRTYNFAKTQEFSLVLRQSLSKYLADDLAPKAIKVLSEIMLDEKVAGRVRVDAAKAVLDRAGFSSAAKPSGPDDRLLSQYTVEELEQLVAKLEEKRALEEGKQIDGEVIEVIEMGDDVDPLA